MNNILTYTFYSNPFSSQLKEIFGEVFVFHKISEDFPRLALEILKRKPQYILGVANFKYRIPQFEHTTINKFHKKGKVSKTGSDQYPLFLPDLAGTPFRKSPRTDDTFCNWTMYKVAHFLDQEKMNTKLMFVHMTDRYLNDLKDLIK